MNRFSQSSLQAAAGSGAELIDQLGTVLYVGGGILFAFVMGLALYAVFGRDRPINARLWILGGGVALPVLTLSALLIYSLQVGNALHATDSPRIRVHVIGEQWWWDVRYELPDGSGRVVLANELHIPVGEPVEIMLSTADVIHSFWVPALAGKVDMIPGRTTRLVLKSEEGGRFRGQCAEYCGGQHALMALFVIAEPRERFEAWLARQTQSAAVPTDAFLRLGYDSFFKAECQQCHAIRGTSAAAELGPDLTHVGSRESLAAGVLDNHVGTMGGWIAGAQDIKPGNRMPSMPVLNGRELRALSAWLASLE
jgi:cytochrome c oxidase subunit 2